MLKVAGDVSTDGLRMFTSGRLHKFPEQAAADHQWPAVRKHDVSSAQFAI